MSEQAEEKVEKQEEKLPDKNLYCFRNCEKATETEVSGTVTGTVPDWLEGTLIRNGPGVYQIGEERMKHMFDGHAILHRFNVSKGTVTYNSKILETDAYTNDKKYNRIVVCEFGTVGHVDPCVGLFDKLKASFNMFKSQGDTKELTDNVSVNVAYYGDQLYAMTETNVTRRVDPKTLNLIGNKTRITDYVAVNSATAHPHVLEDGTVINIGNTSRKEGVPYYAFIRVPPSYGQEETAFKGAEIIGEIPSRWKMNPTYFHSFGMTKDKLIFIETPLCVNCLHLISMPLTNKSYEQCMNWYQNEKALIHIVSLQDGKLMPTTYETDPFFTFHHINAYEEDGQVIVDVAAYDNAEIIKALYENKPELITKAIKNASARRFVLPLNVEGETYGSNLVKLPNSKATAYLKGRRRRGGPAKDKPIIVECKPENLTEEWFELPRINYKLNGSPYEYMYGMGRGEICGNIFGNKILKVSTKNPEDSEEWSTDSGSVSEPVFVAKPGAGNEDEGVVMFMVEDNEEPNKVSLVILDAENFQQLAVADFKTEGAVTTTFHGIWANKDDKVHLY